MKTQTEIQKEIARLKRKIVKILKCPNEYDIIVRDLKLKMKTLDWVLDSENAEETNNG